MQVKTQFDLFLDQIRPHILEYLESKGFNTKKAICCINPEHNDHSPSMLCSSAAEYGWTIKCQSCGFSADIFSAYSILEGKAERGPRWMKEVVLPLAARFGIQPPIEELTPEEQFCHDLYGVYGKVANLLNHDVTLMADAPKAYITSREWTKETLEELDIGTISYDQIQNAIPTEDLIRFGLERDDLFSHENLIFLIRDRFGRPIRFFGRVPEGRKPKYSSTTTSGLLVDLWKDRGRLYLSHTLDSKTTGVVLVEGQSDAVTLWQAGLRNVVALCGKGAYSEAHADMLAIEGISEITIMFDGDEAGQEGTRATLAKPFVRTGGLQYSVAKLADGYDPDAYLRKYGVDKLKYILSDLKISAFEYLLQDKNPNEDIRVISEELIPFIAGSKSEIARETMARELMNFFSGKISLGAIMADVHRADESTVSAILEQQKSIVKAATRQANENLSESKEILRTAIDRLDDLDKREVLGHSIKNTFLARIRGEKTFEETNKTGAYKLRKGGLENLGNLLAGGSWMGGRLILIGAVQNMGKSSLLDQLLWEVIDEPENDAMAYLLTIDDPLESRNRRMMCNAIRDINFTQNMIASPAHFAAGGVLDVYEKRERAYVKLMEKVAGGKLLIEDERDGRTIAHIERRVAQIRRNHPDKKLIVGLDNIYDVADFEGMDMRDRITNIILYAKRIATIYKCTIVCAAEYRKTDPTMPGDDVDFSGSAKMMYAPHLTIHLFSDVNCKGESKAALVHNHNGKYLPRVVATIGKNKITDIKGKENQLFFDFFPASAQFYCIDKEVAKKELAERREELGKKTKGNASIDEELDNDEN